MGRREAFALVAGRCSAAQAESLRRIRDEKIYKQLSPSWEEFCSKRLGMSRRHVDRTLRLLDEFGPAYFHVAQMAHVTPEEYRAIAPHVSADGVRLDGAVVALLPENSEQVSAAVAELLEREKPAKEKPSLSFDAMVKRCDALTDLSSASRARHARTACPRGLRPRFHYGSPDRGLLRDGFARSPDRQSVRHRLLVQGSDLFLVA